MISARSPTCFSFALILGLAVLAPGAGAQSLSDLSAGDRIRLTTSPANGLTGTVVRVAGDSLLFTTGAGPEVQAVPFAGLESLEVAFPMSAGRAAGRGALIGLGVGAVLGAMVAAGTCEPNREDFPCNSARQRVELALLGGVAAGLPGAVIGALVGAAARGTRWVRIPLS